MVYLLFFLFPALTFSLNWQVSTVVDYDDVGAYSSIAVDNGGKPHISYTNLASGRLMYSFWNGSSWTTNVVGTTGSVGYYTSLALDGSTPHISHYNATYRRLLYTKNGTSTLVSSGNVGKFSSLKLDIDKDPNISYYDEGKRALGYVFWTGTYWATSTVDYNQNKDRGRFSSLFLIDDVLPCISYYDATDGDLRFAWWNTTTWGLRTIDTTGDVGQYSSLTGKDGALHIAYYDATNSNLKYAVNPDGTWTLRTLDSIGDVGRYCSIGIDGSNTVYISYYDATNKDLKIIFGSGSTWGSETIDSLGDVGMYTSLAISSNTIHISYYDATNKCLKYATLGTATTPNMPTNLSGQAISSSTINLAWSDNSINELWFIVERGTTDTNFVAIGTTTQSTYTDTGLASLTTYYYRVCSYNLYGTSSYSNIASATTYGIPPLAPSGLIATSTSASSITLTWTDNSTDELGFYIERGQTITTFSLIATATIATYTDLSLQTNTTYYYRVCSYNLYGTSSYSNIASATTLNSIPNPASTLTAYTTSSSQINLSWSDNSNNEQGFIIERKTNAGTFTIIAFAGSNTTSYLNSGLLPNTTYYYRIASYNDLGTSSYSNIASATTGYSLLYLSPSSIIIGSGSTSTVMIMIDNVANLIGASIYLNFNPSILEVETLTQGSFPSGGSLLNASFDNGTGGIIYSVALLTGSSTGSGTLASIEFKGKAGGTSAISFEVSTEDSIQKTSLIDFWGNSIPFNYSNGFASSTVMGSITGKVVSSICGTTFMEFSGINVKILPWATTTTNASSFFSFTGIPEGTWTLWADTYGAGSIARTVYIPGTDTDMGTFTLIAGDCDDSGQVNLSDFYIFRSQYGSTGTGLEADFDHDGTATLSDFYILRSNFGKTRQIASIGTSSTILFISPEKSIAKEAEEVVYEVKIADVKNLVGITLFVHYDPSSLGLISYSKGDFVKDFAILKEEVTNGKIRYDLGLLTGVANGSGSILGLRFSGKKGGSSNITLENTQLMDDSGKWIGFKMGSSSITITSETSFVKIEPQDSTIFIDGTKTIGVCISGQGLIGANIEILYPSDKLEVLNIEKGDFPDVFLFSKEATKITIVGARLGSPTNGLETLANITFKGIKEGCANLSFSLIDVRDKDNLKVSTEGLGGTITIRKYLVGDINRDEKISFDDLMVITTNWKKNKEEADIGPASGIPPNLISNPDGIIDFEDLMVFCLMWNWMNKGVKFYIAESQKPEIFLEKDGNEFLIRYAGFENCIGGNIDLIFEGEISVRSELPIFLSQQNGGKINLAFASLPFLPSSGIIARIKAGDVRFEKVDIRDYENKTIDIFLKEIKPFANIKDAYCYPNPAKSVNSVNFKNLPPNTSIGLYNIAGECIFSQDNFTNPLDIKNIASGVYIYILKNGKDKKVGKLGIVR